MFQSTYQKCAQTAGLTALVLLAVAACAGKGESTSTPQVSTFKPGYMELKNSQANFTHPSGGIISVRSRQYQFRDTPSHVVTLNVASDTPAGQGTETVGDAKYVATDFCAGFSSDKPGDCAYVAVMLYRAQGGKNETRSFLFKPSQGRYQMLCSRDVLYKDGAEAFEKLKAECDPDPQPEQQPVEVPPAASPTPTAAP